MVQLSLHKGPCDVKLAAMGLTRLTLSGLLATCMNKPEKPGVKEPCF